MQLKRLVKKAAKTYKKLPFELKIPFSFFLLILLVAVKTSETTATVSQNAGKRIKNILHSATSFRKGFKRTHRSFKRKLPFKTRDAQPAYTLPIFIKLKYFFLGTVTSFLFAFIPVLMVIFLQDLPHPQELTLRHMPQTTKIYDRNKILLYEVYANQNRTLVSLNDIPKDLQHATLAIEDKNFYKHPGFDIASIIRAFKENVAEGGRIQGGSTITQQLIKSSLLSSEKSFSRKIKEIVIAFWAERIYTKDQILEMYFNQVPYGGTAWGVEAASEVYFGKHVKDLTLGESAFLAGITQAPSMYSPYSDDPSLWQRRQKEVLNRMVALGYISDSQAEKATKQTLAFKAPEVPLRAPHFVMYVKDYLIKQHGLAAVEKGGLTVITSLDLKKQDMAQKIVAEEVEKANYLNLTNGAVVVTDPTNGDILAMIGSKNFNDTKTGNYNLATANRQPGSTVKVITYSAALMEGQTAATIIDDSQQTFPIPGSQPYTPVNYDGRYFGKVTMRFALANSLNTTAVKTLNKVGVTDMVALAQQMGVSSWTEPERYGLSVTLGGAEATMLDMATAFGTLSNKGQRVDLNPVLSIVDAKGTTLEKKTRPARIQVLPESVAYIISDILQDNQARSVAFGANSPLVIPGHTVSVKTGTSDNKRDNWTIGYTKDYVVTVWVGNNDNSPMSQSLASGITGAAPIWHRVMVNLLGNTPDTKPAPPADIVTRQCFGRTEYFVKGTELTIPCSGNQGPSPRVFSSQ